MTKGHRHKKLRNEIYILTAGNGKLLIQGKKAQVINMKRNKMYEVPEKAGHRAINSGKGKLEFLSIYSKDAGHDYDFKFTKRFFKK
jgi:oxalate decarboxylase/phosphoglucose isomerase-like protein (cupin superfamily)